MDVINHTEKCERKEIRYTQKLQCCPPQSLQSTWHTPGDHWGSKSNQHPHEKEKQMKNNTDNCLCIASMPNLSGKITATFFACYDSRWEIVRCHFGLWVIVLCVLSCFLFSLSHCLILYYKHKSCGRHLTHHIPTLCFPFTTALSNTLCGLLTLVFFPQNYFWLSGRYMVWIQHMFPKDRFSRN